MTAQLFSSALALHNMTPRMTPPSPLAQQQNMANVFNAANLLRYERQMNEKLLLNNMLCFSGLGRT